LSSRSGHLSFSNTNAGAITYADAARRPQPFQCTSRSRPDRTADAACADADPSAG
jgi:hypothetical protein